MMSLRSIYRLVRRDFTTVAALTLNLSVALLLFATASTLLWRPPAGVAQARDLVHVFEWTRSPKGTLTHEGAVSQAEASLLADFSSVVTAAATYSCAPTILAYGTQATYVTTCQVSASFFGTLGIRRGIAGRLLDSALAVSEPTAVVLSVDLWHRLFRSDTAILGRTLELGGATMVVAGVAPPGFRGVEGELADVWTVSALWREGGETSAAIAAANPNFRSRIELLRLQRHLDRDYAARALNAYYASRASAAGISSFGQIELRPVVPGLSTYDSVPARVGLWALILLVLAVGSGTASAIDLGALSALQQSPQLRIRWMLGAGRSRLVSGALWQSVTLVCVAGGVALPAATLCWHLLGRGWLGRQVVFGESVGYSILTSMVIAGAILASGLFIPRVLAAAKTTSYSPGMWQVETDLPSHAIFRFALLSAEIALFVIVASSVAALAHRTSAVRHARLGLDTDQLIVGTLERRIQFPSPTQRDNTIDEYRKLALRIHGVESASIADGLPFVGGAASEVRREDGSEVESNSGAVPYSLNVTADYFQTTGTHLVAGRTFTSAEVSTQRAVIVGATFARTVWPHGMPLDACLKLGDDTLCRSVVGVAEDARRRTVADEKPSLQVYLPLHRGDKNDPMRLLVTRTNGDPLAVRDTLRRVFAALGGDAARVRWRTLTEIVEPQWQPMYVGLTLLTYSAIALACSTGIVLYGIFGHVVGRRRREFAIRLSLGASPWRVVGLLVRDVAVQLGIGCAGGLLLYPYARPLLSLPVAGLSMEADTSALAVAVLPVVLLIALALVMPTYRVHTIRPASELRA
jgi:putative ABC transport system permease protein